MSATYCRDCTSSTSGRCWRHPFYVVLSAGVTANQAAQPAPAPERDDLDRPVTQRQFLHAFDVLRKTLRDGRISESQEIWRDPKLRLERALELTWEQLTVELRQKARAEANREEP